MLNAHTITAEFEQALCEYTGAPYAVAVDNQSNALFLALTWFKANHMNTGEIFIPKHTYPSVPNEIIHAGFRVFFMDSKPWLTGEYLLIGSNIYDSALRFTKGMYRPGKVQCLSFTGPYKHLKLTKGGAILTDNKNAYEWFKKARFSGRSEQSYHTDNFDDNPVIGWNFYMMPEIAARGLQMMNQFYASDGLPKEMPDVSLPYPDLSKFDLWK